MKVELKKRPARIPIEIKTIIRCIYKAANTRAQIDCDKGPAFGPLFLDNQPINDLDNSGDASQRVNAYAAWRIGCRLKSEVDKT